MRAQIENRSWMAALLAGAIVAGAALAVGADHATAGALTAAAEHATAGALTAAAAHAPAPTLAAKADVTPAAFAPVTVKVRDFKFEPAAVTVPAGTTVTWRNDDEESHTITSTEGAFKSEALESTARFSYTFTKPGTYHYFCALHPHMRADVIVR